MSLPYKVSLHTHAFAHISIEQLEQGGQWLPAEETKVMVPFKGLVPAGCVWQ